MQNFIWIISKVLDLSQGVPHIRVLEQPAAIHWSLHAEDLMACRN